MAEQSRTIRLPVHMARPSAGWPGCGGSCRDLGREPTPGELAAELDMTPGGGLEVQKHGREPISLHAPLRGGRRQRARRLIEDSEAIQPDEAVVPSLPVIRGPAVTGPGPAATGWHSSCCTLTWS